MTEEDLANFDDTFENGNEVSSDDLFRDLFNEGDSGGSEDQLYDSDADPYGVTNEDFDNLDDGYSREGSEDTNESYEDHIFEDGEDINGDEGFYDDEEEDVGFFDEEDFEEGGDFAGEDEEDAYFEDEEEAEEKFYDELEREYENLEEEEKERDYDGDTVFNDPYADGAEDMENGFAESPQYHDIDDFGAEEEDERYISNTYAESDDTDNSSISKIGFAVLGLTVGMVVLVVGWVFYSRHKSPTYPMTSEYEKLTPGDMSMYGSDVFMEDDEESM